MVAARPIRVLTAALAAAALFGCAAPRSTVYKARDGGFGSTETRMEDGAWRVAFTGNRATRLETAENYALYRAAEITLRGGFERFAVIDREIGQQVERSQAFHHRPPGFDSRERRNDATLLPADPFVDNRMEITITYVARLIIRPYSGAAPAGAERIYAAREVLDRLGPGIKRLR